jgi:adenosylhomocysteinase
MNAVYDITDISLEDEGRRKIEWVSHKMPVLNKLCDRFQGDGVFRGKTVAVSIHLEAKTAYLCLILKKLGAEVWATGSNPFSTKDDVCATLAKDGVNVFAHHGVSAEDHRKELGSLLKSYPQAVLDDGADICMAMHDFPEYGERLNGFSEETTTGVLRLRQLESTGKLLFPAVTVNNAKSKHLFDNRYGTGQSTWTAVTHLTNLTIGGKKVVILGYGWVGRGVATVAQGMGAHIIITELDPWKALEAHMDGYEVMPLADAVRCGDIFITATGLEGVLRTEHLVAMKSGALIGNAGHSDLEIDVPALRKMCTNIVFRTTGRFIFLRMGALSISQAGWVIRRRSSICRFLSSLRRSIFFCVRQNENRVCMRYRRKLTNSSFVKNSSRKELK